MYCKSILQCEEVASCMLSDRIHDTLFAVHNLVSILQSVLALLDSGQTQASSTWWQVLAPLRRVSPAYEREVEAVFALIAYEAPAESPLQHLVSDRAREAVADVVNAAILLDAQRAARAAAIAAETGAKMLDLLCQAALAHACCFGRQERSRGRQAANENPGETPMPRAHTATTTVHSAVRLLSSSIHVGRLPTGMCTRHRLCMVRKVSKRICSLSCVRPT